ncbi:unnamed protein product [Rotaria magnacalcarata]|uniref:VIT domain-containing protein n=1 Tax=Rotaria magnacalcarata TaxID=392030 RepID=A0A819KFJ3_9BILA|nr:unnamed protein product [Rotaria magnacalcarata]CAF3943752.1 unnamed protein product [Rotaria magnacalcarata]
MLCIKRNPTTADGLPYVLLKKDSIEAKIYSLYAEVTLTQIFCNNEHSTGETMYCFPVKRVWGTIKSFVALIDGQHIVNIKDVQRDYTDQLTHDNDTYSSERDENLQDNFIIKVGTLLPSQQCTIAINYTTELGIFSNANLQFVIPMIEIHHNNRYGQLNSYTIDFHCTVDNMADYNRREITQITSPSHLIHIELSKQNIYYIKFMEQSSYLDRDIQINIEQIEKPTGKSVALFSSKILTTNTVGQPFDYYCVLDFEAVCHEVNSSLKRPAPNDIWEIIEFPICLLSAETNTIIDVYHSYVRPSIKTTLNEVCISITGITQSIADCSPTFDIVWEQVQQFLLKHSLISLADHNSSCHSFTWITCGNWDLKTMLPLQLKQSRLDRPEFINEFINIKELYMEYYSSTRIRGMKDLLKKLNLKLEGRHHSGIDDTKNITKIAQWFIEHKHPLKLTYKENGHK